MSKRSFEQSEGLRDDLASNGKAPRIEDEEATDPDRPSDEDSRAKRGGRTKAVPRRGIRSKALDDKLPQVWYKEGETLKDLAKFLNADGDGQCVLVRIPPESMSPGNRQVRARQLWGNDVYTQDSDIVAALMHTGHYSIALPRAPPSVVEVRCVVRALPPMPRCTSISRNSIRSRAWGAKLSGCSYRIERCWLVTRSGGQVDLEATREAVPGVAPTFIPAHFERVMNTRATAASTERRQRTMQEVTLQYNLVNEPWVKYGLMPVADQGLKPVQWTSARLHREVLYLETRTQRYEVSRVEAGRGEGGEDAGTGRGETYRWARCKAPLPLAKMREIGVPLPDTYLDVLEPALAWEDLQWSPNGVYVKGKLTPVVRLHFTQRKGKPNSTPPPEPRPQHTPVIAT